MKKPIIIIFIAIIISLFGLSLYIYISASNKINVRTISIDSSEIEGQIEYINVLKDGPMFLTYKETAVAKYNLNKELSILSDQVITGVIEDVWYWSDNNKLLIKFVNDPFTISEISGYKETDNESVYATYNIKTKKLQLLPSGPQKCWLENDKIVGVKDKEIYTFDDFEWKNNELDIGTDEPVISSNGTLVGKLEENRITVYEIDSKDKRIVEAISPANFGRVRLFDNGDVLIIDGSETVRLYQVSGKLKKINIPKEEQIIVGKNTFLYTQQDKTYMYNSEKSKTYELNNVPKDIDIYNLFGLNTVGAIYYTDKDYVFDLLMFEEN